MYATCLVCPIIKDLFSIILKAPAVRILYISFPKPASEDLPMTKPCLQNCSGGSCRTLEAPKMEATWAIIDLKMLTNFLPENHNDKRFWKWRKSQNDSPNYSCMKTNKNDIVMEFKKPKVKRWKPRRLALTLYLNKEEVHTLK